jgi:hypothetical protein
MSASGKAAARYITGFAVVVGIAASMMVIPGLGRANLFTGIMSGIAVAYLGFLLLYFLFPRPAEKGERGSFFQGYIIGAVLRYAIMISAFCGVVFGLHINPIGVLIGAFAGMMTSTFISLNKMRQTTPKS